MRGDFARVAQILANLINNAAKYTDQGGRISLTAAREGAEVVFRVRDTGMGIPRDLLSRIFEPFTQIDRTLDRSQGGLGIGLTLVRRLVEMQGGACLRLQRGSGPRQRIHGPPASRRRRRRGPKRARKESDRGRAELPPDLRVLIVDDNRDVAESTAALLRLEGCDVHLALRWRRGASRGAARVTSGRHPARHRPAADERLPKSPSAFARSPTIGDVSIVAVSGYGQEEHRLRSQQAGFDHHIVKPIDPALLTGLLASLWSHRSAAAPENVVSFPARKTVE